MTFNHLVAILAAVTVVTGAPLAADDTKSDNPGDKRVHHSLKANDLKYRVDDDGDFRVVLNFSDDRSHLVFINSSTSSLTGMEIREIWSVGYHEEDGVPADMLEPLLKESGEQKLGAWELTPSGTRAVFTAKVPADLSPEAFHAALRAVAITADEFEKEHHKSDEL